ncbi:transposase domain-containing protein, partial [Aestuariicoccus sp. MJ-SS9]|uniref:transposase domain-containing protein n=1 Tax=Aestuariicoccus sp. MJ-SS9 TaxID=3079855 RepID=UPI00290F8BC3
TLQAKANKIRHFSHKFRALGVVQTRLDNNTVERTIRPIALNRKNALFAGHDAGAENWAVIASLIETCKLNVVDPHAWLAATLSAIATGHMHSQVDDLLP